MSAPVEHPRAPKDQLVSIEKGGLFVLTPSSFTVNVGTNWTRRRIHASVSTLYSVVVCVNIKSFYVIDVDECARGSHTCAIGSTCINDEGSFRCEDPIVCPSGTRPSSDQRTCIGGNSLQTQYSHLIPPHKEKLKTALSQ